MPEESENARRERWSTKVPARLAAAAVLALTMLLAIGLPASADGGIWCVTDPVVTVGGTQVNILVAIPAEFQPRVNGPVVVQIATARQVPHSLDATDAGFNGYGEQVQFIDLPRLDASKVFVTVRVPISTDTTKSTVVPVRLTLAPSDGDQLTFYGSNRMTVGGFQVDAG